MQLVRGVLGIGILFMLAGCSNFRFNVLDRGRDEPRGPETTGVPSKAQLVEYMNVNAQRIRSLRCEDIEMSCSSGLQLMPSLSGKLVCQGQKHLRMKATWMGKDQLDIGSNDQEFWFWIRQIEPPHQFYCSYEALERGEVKRMPLPFQPNWVMETLGLSEFGPAERYEEMVVERDKFKLIEKARSPQGKPVKKVIVFQRLPARGSQPQITDYLLVDDATGKEICSAKVMEIQVVDKLTWIPRRLELRWPDEKLKLSMRLNGASINHDVPQAAFVRAPLPGIAAYDLATGRLDATPNSLQRAGGAR